MADKAIFSQPENVDPELTKSLALGSSSEPSETITFSSLLAWLYSKLGFFKVANNLSESNAASVRTNIDVFSTWQVSSALALKADKANVLERTNTDAYTPTLATHPATKGYVDSSGVKGSMDFSKGIYTGTNIEHCNISIRSRGNIVNVTGRIKTNGADGRVTPFVVFTIPAVNLVVPLTDYTVFVGLTGRSDLGIATVRATLGQFGGALYMDIYSDTAATNELYFNATYIV